MFHPILINHLKILPQACPPSSCWVPQLCGGMFPFFLNRPCMCLARCCDRTLIFGPVARRGGGGILREAHAVLQRRCLRIVVKQREALALWGGRDHFCTLKGPRKGIQDIQIHQPEVPIHVLGSLSFLTRALALVRLDLSTCFRLRVSLSLNSAILMSESWAHLSACLLSCWR